MTYRLRPHLLFTAVSGATNASIYLKAWGTYNYYECKKKTQYNARHLEIMKASNLENF